MCARGQRIRCGAFLSDIAINSLFALGLWNRFGVTMRDESSPKCSADCHSSLVNSECMGSSHPSVHLIKSNVGTASRSFLPDPSRDHFYCAWFPVDAATLPKRSLSLATR